MKQSFASQKENFSKRANFFRIMSRSIAEGMKAGSFRSLAYGHGIEFSGVRDYMIGDDIRAIDWNVTARMCKPFVKLFEEERELNIFFVFDCSLSLFTGSNEKTKIDIACEIIALLTFAAEQNNCPIGAVFFDGNINFCVSPKSGLDRTMIIIKKLDKLVFGKDNISVGSILPDALNGAFSMLKKRSLVFVVSDFRVSGYETSLARLAYKHDCVAIRIASPYDTELPNVGALHAIDSETKKHIVLPTNSASFKKEWKKAEKSRAAKWYDTCLKRGVAPLTISTTQDPAFVLSSFFDKRGKLNDF